MKLMHAFVYIMSNKHATTFYIGVTNNLERRVKEHKSNQSDFTSRYNLHCLVYFEKIDDIKSAKKKGKAVKSVAKRMENKINSISKSYF